jgi:hypothetical protein
MLTVRVEYQLEVESTASRLWDILADVKAWPEWQGTPYVDPPAGPPQNGSTFVAMFGGQKWNFTIAEADRPRRLVWVGRARGLRAIHEWEFLEAQGRTIATSRESISGWMLLCMRATVQKGVSETDEKWLADLKSRAESGLA